MSLFYLPSHLVPSCSQFDSIPLTSSGERCTILGLVNVAEGSKLNESLDGCKLRIKYYFHLPKACQDDAVGKVEGESNWTSREDFGAAAGSCTFEQTDYLPHHRHGCTSKGRVATLLKSKRSVRFDVEKRGKSLFTMMKTSQKASAFLPHRLLPAHATVERDLPLYAPSTKEAPPRRGGTLPGAPLLRVRVRTRAALVGGETEAQPKRCPLFTARDFPAPVDGGAGGVATAPLDQLRIASSAAGDLLCSSGAHSAVSVLEDTADGAGWSTGLTSDAPAWLCFDLGRDFLRTGAAVSAVTVQYTAALPKVALTVEVQCALDAVVSCDATATLAVACGEQRSKREWMTVAVQQVDVAATATAQRHALGPAADASGRVAHWCARWWRLRWSTTAATRKPVALEVERVVFLGGATAGGAAAAPAAGARGAGPPCASGAVSGGGAAQQRLAAVEAALATHRSALAAARARGGAATAQWKQRFTSTVKALVNERKALHARLAAAGGGSQSCEGTSPAVPSLEEQLAAVNAAFDSINAALQAAKAAPNKRAALGAWKAEHHARYKELGAKRVELTRALTPVPPEELADPLATKWMTSVEVLHNAGERWAAEAQRLRGEARKTAQLKVMSCESRESSFVDMIQSEQLSMAEYLAHCVGDRRDADVRLARALRSARRATEAAAVERRVADAAHELAQAKEAGLL